MTTTLKRYDFSERLAEILGESRRDLRVRVTMLVAGGLIPPGRRGPGAPPATPDYAADLLIGVLAAPAQVHTVEAVRCYRDLRPTRRIAGGPSTGIVLGPRRGRALALPALSAGDVPLLVGAPVFGAMLARLLDRARRPETRDALARDVFGVWVGRGCPVAAVQLATWAEGQRTVLSQRYDLADGAPLPAWLDPKRGGLADPGLFHTVFLPVRKLIDIGALTAAAETAPTSALQLRRPAMIDLGPRLSRLAEFAQLTHETRHRRPWKKFLEKAVDSIAVTEGLEEKPGRLTEVADFGPNPGNLRMKCYVPEGLPAGAPLVVALHGCTQSAESYDRGTGWSTLADRHGFAVLLPDQRRRNNPLRCFSWFKPEDVVRDGGEAASIRRMVERMCLEHGIERRRVYVTGVSAGGAMTAALLAAYPDVFAGGAIIAGVPYGAASNLQEGFEAIFQGRSLTAEEWGHRVRAASPHAGPWPTVAVWHGDADSTVTPSNAEEAIKQWANVHALPPTPTVEHTVDGGHRRRVWHDADGREVIESWTVAGMAHGVPIAAGGPDGCGEAAPFILDVGLSSTFHIARAWGLTETLFEAPARPAAAASPCPPAPAAFEAEPVAAANIPVPVARRDGEGARWWSEDAAASNRAAPGGLDIHGIIAQSLAAAGLISGGSRRPASSAPLGIDIPAILATSFEAAGLLRSDRTAPPKRAAEPVTVNAPEATPEAPKSASEAAPEAAPEIAPGWRLVAGGGALLGAGSVLHGHVVSGVDSRLGEATRRIACRITLGNTPRLSYARRLDLRAAANMFTTAAFSVLVDDVPVDEATASGMDYAEPAWTDRLDIDLAPFAGRTVTLTFETLANANLLVEVSAEAWVRDVVLHDAVAAEAAEAVPV